MRITTLIALFALLMAGSLQAQAPATEREALHRENLVSGSFAQYQPLLEEKRARLTEAVSDGDRESAVIMQAEVLEVMDKFLLNLPAQFTSEAAASAELTATLDRMKAIRQELAALELAELGAEKARQAGSFVTEFLTLMGRLGS